MPRKGLKQKFVVYLVLLVIFISFTFLGFFINRSNALIEHELTQIGFSLVKSLSYSSEVGVASRDVIFLKPYFDKVFKETDVILVAVYTKDGTPLLINKKIPTEDRIPIEVMQTIVNEEDVLKVVSYADDGEEFYDFYAPIIFGEIFTLGLDQEKELSGFARVGISKSGLTSQIRTILLLGLSITVLLSILGIFISFFIANRLVKPIKELEKGAKAFAKGNFKYRIKVQTGDEIEDLADSFNTMAKAVRVSTDALEETKKVLEIKVKARTEELQELADNLEDEVERRTTQLSQRVKELERFYRLTVGRELKMIELKKELKLFKGDISGLVKKTSAIGTSTEKSLLDIEQQKNGSRKVDKKFIN